jgi:hypothetical protein
VKNISVALRRGFYALFTITFGWVLINSIFRSQHGLNGALLLFLTAAFTALFALFFNALRRRPEPSSVACAAVLTGFIAVTAGMLLVIGLRLRYTPAFDLDAIFGGGRDWVLTGSFDRYQEYFAMFITNLGGLFLFRCVFSVYSLFGGNDFFAAALVVNIILLELMVYALYDSARRLAGCKAGLMALFILGMFLPFYTMGAVFYTDVLSMPFVALTYNFYLRGKDANGVHRRIMLFAAAGAAAGIGATIKFTTAIALIAVAIDFVLTTEWRRKEVLMRIAELAAAIAVFALLLTGFHGYMSSKQDAELVNARRHPLSHWVAMGLHGSGGYDWQDYENSKALPNASVRKAANAELIKARIRDNGFSGMFALLTRKTALDFGNGTYALSDFLDDAPANQTALHNIVLYAGKHYDVYAHVATGMSLALLLLAICGAALSIRRPGHIAPWVSLFGLLMFLCFWETSARYTQNHLPLMIICAVLALNSFNGAKSNPIKSK